MPLVVAWASLPMNPGQEARDTKHMGREAHATCRGMGILAHEPGPGGP
jgi:hypothetical protein